MTPDPDPTDIPDDESATGAPIADKGVVGAPMHGTERPADGLGTTPGVSPDAIDAVMDEGGRRELDFEEGVVMDSEEITQGESVIEAAYGDRGPATHLDPDAGDRLDRMSAAEVLEALTDDIPLERSLVSRAMRRPGRDFDRDLAISEMSVRWNISNREIGRIFGVSHPTVGAALKRFDERDAK